MKKDDKANGQQLALVSKGGDNQLAHLNRDALSNDGSGSGGSSTETPGQKEDRIRGENLSLCMSMIQFFLFLLTFSTAMLVNQSVATSRLSDHIRLKLNPSRFQLTTIKNTEHMYDYLEQVVVPGLFENNTDTRVAEQTSTYFTPIDVSNRMLGPIRLRQARVELKDNCQVTPLFEKYSVSCYPGYAEDTKSETSFGPEDKYKYSSGGAGSMPFAATFATYDGNGFMFNLATNTTGASAHLEMLRADVFMDSATRALFTEFNIWNSNIGLYAVVQIVVEFGPSGGVKHEIEIMTMTQRQLNAGGLGATEDWLAFALLICVMFFVVQFGLEEIQEIMENWRSYFFDAWNLLDWVNMILLLVGFTLRCLLFADAGNADIGVEQLDNVDSFQVLTKYASDATTARVLNAFNCVLLWGKVTKYLRHMPVVKDLMRTVWGAFDLFLPFLIMFSVAFLGFVMAFNIGFGDKLPELANFTTSFVYLCRAFLKDVTLMPVYDITPMFGAMLILLFYVNMMLVAVALMLAMMADSIFNSKYSIALKNKYAEAAYWHEDEPIEELYRTTTSTITRYAIQLAPLTYARYVKFMKARREAAEPTFSLEDKDDEKLALGNGTGGDWNNQPAIDDKSDSDYDSSEEDTRPSPEELKRAIEHMSGRILSEITVVGIEIRSELHDVCERVAQMQMAVEELTWRTDKVRSDQELEMAEEE